jgi:FxLD family lantipeptide
MHELGVSAPEEETVTVQIEQVAAPLVAASDSGFDLDVTLLEVADPGHLINMTDDGCGNTCEKSTCITGA